MKDEVCDTTSNDSSGEEMKETIEEESKKNIKTGFSSADIRCHARPAGVKKRKKLEHKENVVSKAILSVGSVMKESAQRRSKVLL